MNRSILLLILIMILTGTNFRETVYLDLNFDLVKSRRISIDISKFDDKGTYKYYDKHNKIYYILSSLGMNGMVKLKAVDTINNIQVVGSFSSGLDTCRGQAIAEDINGDIVRFMQKKFVPYQDSIWVYMNLKNEILYKKYFRKGMDCGDSINYFQNQVKIH